MLFEEQIKKGIEILDKKDADTAIKYFTQLCELNPVSPEAHFYLGNAFQQKDDYENAIANYDKAITLGPEHAFFLTRGIAYAFLENLEQAIDDCTSALKLKPEYADAYQMRGVFYDQQNNKTKAVEDEQQAANIFYSQNRIMEFAGAIYFLKAINPDLLTNNFVSEKIPISESLIKNRSKTEIELDADLIKRSSPESVLKTLIFLRAKNSEGLFNEQGESFYEDIVHLLKPVNPLSMITAICLYIIKGFDYHSFLSNYLFGKSVVEIDNHLFQLPDFESDSELEKYLEIENKYVEAFCLLTLESILCTPSTKSFFSHSVSFQPTPETLLLSPDTLLEYLKLAKDFNIPEELGFSVFHIYYYAYKLANPFYLILGLELVEKLLANYGFSTNSDIHNVRDYYEYQQELNKQQLNEILRSNLSKEEKRIKLERQKISQQNASKLADRIFRFYNWNPVESSAHGFANEYSKQYFGKTHLYS